MCQNLREAIGWNAFLWKNRRHWAVVLQPVLGGELKVLVEHFKLMKEGEAEACEQVMCMACEEHHRLSYCYSYHYEITIIIIMKLLLSSLVMLIIVVTISYEY